MAAAVAVSAADPQPGFLRKGSDHQTAAMLMMIQSPSHQIMSLHCLERSGEL